MQKVVTDAVSGGEDPVGDKLMQLIKKKPEHASGFNVVLQKWSSCHFIMWVTSTLLKLTQGRRVPLTETKPHPNTEARHYNESMDEASFPSASLSTPLTIFCWNWMQICSWAGIPDPDPHESQKWSKKDAHFVWTFCLTYPYTGEVQKVYPGGWDSGEMLSKLNQGFIDYWNKCKSIAWQQLHVCQNSMRAM